MRKTKNKIARLLRRSEKYTKTDMLYLTRNGFWVSLGRTFTIIAGFVLSLAFANLLDPNVYGTYQFILSVGSIIVAFSLTGFKTAISKSVANGYEGSLKFAYIENLKWSLGIVVLTIGACIYYLLNQNTTLAIGILIVGLTTPLINSAKLYASFLLGKKLFKVRTQYGIVQNVISALVVLGVLLVTTNILLLLAAYYAARLVMVTYFYFQTSKKYVSNSLVDSSITKYTQHLSAMSIIGVVAGNIDKILIFHFIGAAEVAIYTIALIIPKHLQNLTEILKTLALPRFSENTIMHVKKSVWHKMLLLTPVGILLTIAYIISAPVIFSLLYPNYLPSIPLSQVFALTLLFIPSSLFTPVFLAHEKTKELYITKTLVPIIKILLLLILLPLYGMWGAITALLITRLASFSIAFYLFAKMKS